MYALLVIDMQKALFTENSRRHDPSGVVERINQLIARAREKNIAIIFVRHFSTEEKSLVAGSEGWQILPDLDVRDGDAKIEKGCCDAFCRTKLEDELKAVGAQKLIISGCCTDFCIDTTVRQAASMDYQVIVAADAHTTADKPYLDAETIIKHHNFVWSELYAPQPIEVLGAEEIIQSL